MGIREHVGRWAAALCLVAAAQGAVAGPYSNLYVFGDSLSDTGNDLLVTGGAVPSPAYYTDGTTVGRFTNGRNYVDFLADGLGLSVSPSQLGGTNYAYGGARVNGQAAGLPPTALSFNQQVASYMATHAAGTDPNALYVVWIGANDVSDAIAAAVQAAAMAVNPADVPGIINGVLGAAIGSVMSSLGNALGGLAALGASHFLVPNLPDLSLTPEVRAIGNPFVSGVAKAASVGFNQVLSGFLGSFAVLDIATIDVFSAQTHMTLDPAAFGLVNVSDACFDGDLAGSGTPTVCANPDAFLYWDYEHPTSALHAEIGRLALMAVPEPAGWSLLLIGLGGIGLMGRRRRH